MTKLETRYAEKRICTRCKIEREIDQFTKLKPRKKRKQNPDLPTQYYTPRGDTYDCYCRPCRYELGNIRRRKNANRKDNPLISVPEEDIEVMRFIRYKLRVIKMRCKLRKRAHGKDFDLDDWFLLDAIKKQNLKCPYTGLDYIFELDHERAPSLDRIDSALGYTKNNVEWVCWAVNRAKGEMTSEDFIAMCHRVSEKDKQNAN